VAIFTTLVMLGAAAAAEGSAYRVIHTFRGWPDDGCEAVGVPAVAKNGDLYGVTYACGTHEYYGTVFKLAAPRTPGGAWKESILYDFTSADSGNPTTLVIGRDGTLYGAGYNENYPGFIFQLKPPVGRGAWQFNVLYTFNPNDKSDGIFVQGITLDADGNIYGATGLGGNPSCSWGGGLGCGVVFELKRPTKNGGNWAFSVLYAFTGNPDAAIPVTGVTLDQKGNIYGTTNNGGTYGAGTTAVLKIRCLASGGLWSDAAGALVMALQAGWTVGDTIGAIFFGAFALLVAYEVVRRRRAASSLNPHTQTTGLPGHACFSNLS